MKTMWTSKTNTDLVDHELTFLVFKANYRSLTERCTPLAQAIDIMWDQTGRFPQQPFIETTAAFHNFLLACATLVDHYRILTKKASTSEAFKTTYEAEMAKVFHDDLLSLCVKKLRNMVAHKSLPKINVILTDGLPIRYAIALDVQDLILSFDWSEKELSYLSSLEDHVEIISLIEPYFDRVRKFYEWFMPEYASAHNQLEELNLLFEKLPDGRSDNAQ